MNDFKTVAPLHSRAEALFEKQEFYPVSYWYNDRQFCGFHEIPKNLLDRIKSRFGRPCIVSQRKKRDRWFVDFLYADLLF